MQVNSRRRSINQVEILQDTDPRCAELEAMGYILVGESWGARLKVEGDIGSFSAVISKVTKVGVQVKEIGIEFAERVLELEIVNNPDYPVTPANVRPLQSIDEIRELWVAENRIFGALFEEALVGVLATSPREDLVELDFASILRDQRGKGIGKALVAAAILGWVREGTFLFGTGGAGANEASLGTVKSLGFAITERWRSYQPPL